MLAISAVFAATQAVAYPAFTNAEVYLRAGPDMDFPIVHVLRPRTLLEVIGCQQDYQWCDVRSDVGRGWVSGNHLVATFDNREVNLARIGAEIGLPVLAFLVGAYWADHYFDRPWYGRHPHWNNLNYRPRPPHGGVMPRPPRGSRPSMVRPGVRPPPGGVGPRPPPGVRPPPGANRPARPYQPMPERNSR